MRRARLPARFRRDARGDASGGRRARRPARPRRAGGTEAELLLIPARYCGPRGFGHGGYVAGSLARELRGPAEVTIRRPVRLEHAFAVQRLGRDGVALLDGDEVVAEATPAPIELAVPAAPDFETVCAASANFRGAPHHNPGCFGCGPERRPGDGLGLRPAHCAGLEGVASAWVPDAASVGRGGVVLPELIWAALDCPGAYALDHPTMVLLGRIAARIDRAPRAGERLRLLGWPLGREGRKLNVGTALIDEGGDAIAVARAVWIELRPGVWERMRG